MPDIAITWPALLAVLGAVATVGGAVAKLYGAMRAEFERSRVESEARAVRMHERMDGLTAQFVPRETLNLELARVNDALREREQQINDVAARIGCQRRTA